MPPTESWALFYSQTGSPLYIQLWVDYYYEVYFNISTKPEHTVPFADNGC